MLFRLKKVSSSWVRVRATSTPVHLFATRGRQNFFLNFSGDEVKSWGVLGSFCHNKYCYFNISPVISLNDFKTKNLRKLGKSGKSIYHLVPSLLFKLKMFLILAENCWKIEIKLKFSLTVLFVMESIVCLIYFFHDWKSNT